MTNKSSLDSSLLGPTDSDLVAQGKNGQSGAMHTLFERYHVRIYRYLLYMVGHELIAAELTQEVFLKAWDGLLNITPHDCFEDWLYCIATNLVQLYESQYHSQHITQIQYSNMSSLNCSMQASKVIFALSKITFLYRACLVLRDAEGLSFTQIAQRFKMKPKQVELWRERGMTELFQLLPDGFTFEHVKECLGNFPVLDKVISSPFLQTIEPHRYYVPFLTVTDSYVKPPRLPLRAKFHAIPQRAKTLLFPFYFTSKPLTIWAYFCIICAVLSLLVTSSGGGNMQDRHPITTVQSSCTFNKDFISNYDSKEAICVRQSLWVHDYKFTLEQVYLNTNQILLSTRLEDFNHRSPMFLIAPIHISILSGSSIQYICSASYSVAAHTPSHMPIITPLFFNGTFAGKSFYKAREINLTIEIYQVQIFLLNSEQNKFSIIPLLKKNEKPLKFNLSLSSLKNYLRPAHPLATPNSSCEKK